MPKKGSVHRSDRSQSPEIFLAVAAKRLDYYRVMVAAYPRPMSDESTDFFPPSLWAANVKLVLPAHVFDEPDWHVFSSRLFYLAS